MDGRLAAGSLGPRGLLSSHTEEEGMMSRRLAMIRSAAWLTALSMSIAMPAAAQAPGPGWEHGPWMMGDGGWAWMMFFGPLVMILFIAAVVVLVAFALRWLSGHGAHGASHASPPSAGRTPLDILKERFARGEIDKAEFEERRRVLGE